MNPSDPGPEPVEAWKGGLTGPTPPEVAAAVDIGMRRGSLVTVVGVVVLALFTSLPFWEVLALPVFLLLLPALALAQLPLLDSHELERIPVYLGSGITILLVGGIALVLGVRIDGPEALGLVPLPPGELLAWSGGMLAGGLVLIGIFHPLDRRVPGRHHRVLAQLLPRTASERAAFVGLAGAAGVGEELAYRGYAILGLQLLGPGPWAAAAISSVAFGFLHAYQGPVGVLRTGAMGMVLALPVLLTGSILPAVLGHALIDLVAGLLLGPFLVHGSTEEETMSQGGTAGDPLVPPRRDG